MGPTAYLYFSLSEPRNQMALMIAGIGFLMIGVTYASYIVKPKDGHHVSGAPLFGGLLIFLGFIISTNRWLALLAFLDPGILQLLSSLIDLLLTDRRNKSRFGRVIDEKGLHGGVSDSGENILVTGANGEIELKLHYGYPYEVRDPRYFFMVCRDESGARWLLFDRRRWGSRVEIIPFDSGSAEIENVMHRGTALTVKLIKINRTKNDS
ncbi:MAG: hypothetical protein IJ737_04880 [Ruminococcus sp.]|nr:hypothetical protein [Ruminococcus sp.]